MALEIIQNIVIRSIATISGIQREDSFERVSYNHEEGDIHEDPIYIKDGKCETPFFAPGHP